VPRDHRRSAQAVRRESPVHADVPQARRERPPHPRSALVRSPRLRRDTQQPSACRFERRCRSRHSATTRRSSSVSAGLRRLRTIFAVDTIVLQLPRRRRMIPGCSSMSSQRSALTSLNRLALEPPCRRAPDDTRRSREHDRAGPRPVEAPRG
jgi:hypothetical protein